jgi:hypothetical protein
VYPLDCNNFWKQCSDVTHRESVRFEVQTKHIRTLALVDEAAQFGPCQTSTRSFCLLRRYNTNHQIWLRPIVGQFGAQARARALLATMPLKHTLGYVVIPPPKMVQGGEPSE